MPDFVLHRTDDIGSDVILIAGQSNAAEYGQGKDATFLELPDPRIRQWAMAGTYLGKTIAAVDGQMQYRIPTTDATRIGFATTFARNWVRVTPPNRHVLIVPAAQGSTGFTTSSLASPPTGYTQGQEGAASGSWDPAKGDGGYSLYQAAIDATNAAVASNPANRLVAMLWIQGEADGTLFQSTYAPKIDALIAGFRSSITGAANVPFIIGQMVPDWVSFNASINAAQVDTPRRVQRTAFAYGFTGMSNSGEPYHYAAAAQRLMGKALFDLLPYARVNVPGTAPLAPSAITLAQDGTTATTLHVKWTRPLSRVTDYNVRYSTNSGSTWTVLTRTQSIDAAADITGLSSSATVLVQAAAANETGTSAWSASGTITMIPPAVANTVAPALSGTATNGSTLTAGNGTWSVTPDSYGYQWTRSGSAISGATASTYTLTSTDSYKDIACIVTAIKAGYSNGSANSNALTVDLPTGYSYRMRAADLAGLTDGQLISSLPFQTGALTLVQSTIANQPSYLASGQGSRPAVRFDGGAAYIAAASGPTVAQPLTVYAMVDWKNITGTRKMLAASGISASINDQGTGYSAYASGTTIVGGTLTTGFQNDAWAFSGASSRVVKNGTQVITGNPGSASLSGAFNLGSSNGTYQAAQIDLYELYIYPRALTDAEIAQLRAYSTSFYGA